MVTARVKESFERDVIVEKVKLTDATSMEKPICQEKAESRFKLMAGIKQKTEEKPHTVNCSLFSIGGREAHFSGSHDEKNQSETEVSIVEEREKLCFRELN